MPKYIIDSVEEDVQALIWGKDVTFDAEEAGTHVKFRRWMKKDAQYGNRKTHLGIGLLPWRDHLKALQVNWLLKYMDGSRGEWKFLLDAWFARHPEGRGAIFSTLPANKLVTSTTYRQGALPRFWVHALQALRELPLTKADPRRWTLPDARAHPVWYSPIFSVKNKLLMRAWRDDLELTHAINLRKQDGTSYSDTDLLTEAEDKYECSSRGDFYIRHMHYPVKPASLLKSWRDISQAVPAALLDVLSHKHATPEMWRYSKAAQSMMHSMGWLRVAHRT